ncbi:hypothetical protein ACNF5F_26750, partial [Escherichia coli]|uniref:hypothetical protein n=1 Tax=Escherichia coli TaxID=562 RepID=UPI003B9EB3A1
AARRDVTQRHYLTGGMSHNRGNVRAVYEDCFAAIRDPSAPQIQTALLRASSRVFFAALGCEVDVDPLLDFFARARSYVKHLQYH